MGLPKSQKVRIIKLRIILKKFIIKGAQSMINQAKLTELHIKILPHGADRVLELLEKHVDRVEFVSFVIEKVPLLIIGRHGMIARLPQNNVTQKFSQPAEIINALRGFFTQQETLYLFINLPNLPVPQHISDLIEEIADKLQTAENIRRQIDNALDQRDQAAFLRWTQQLRTLEAKDSSSLICGS